MIIGLISDVHDNTANLAEALRRLRAAACRHLLFAGDLTGSRTLDALCRDWPYELDMVAGNCDPPDLSRAAEGRERVRFHGDCAELLLDGRHIFLTHSPYTAQNALAYASFDAVFFGHTHRPMNEMHGRTLVANPGDLQGRFGCPSFALYDTALHSLAHYYL